jgi:hypothetical protein
MKKILNAVFNQGLPERDIKNANQIMLWAFAWAATLVIISICSKYAWFSSALPITIAFVLHTGIGIGMILAYKRFLRELDEMERKIQLDALALSAGATVVAFSSYSILEKAGILPDLNPAYLIAFLALTYSAGLIIGRIRYR